MNSKITAIVFLLVVFFLFAGCTNKIIGPKEIKQESSISITFDVKGSSGQLLKEVKISPDGKIQATGYSKSTAILSKEELQDLGNFILDRAFFIRYFSVEEEATGSPNISSLNIIIDASSRNVSWGKDNLADQDKLEEIAEKVESFVK
ncbi:MAG: hypothetical protein Q7K42_06545 [Candidatus Diapherotrites archaeon]|nr:hypothetical protein [Candidatus Diapherotrites archaeon]